jgi:hypothetical protein
MAKDLPSRFQAAQTGRDDPRQLLLLLLRTISIVRRLVKGRMLMLMLIELIRITIGIVLRCC